MKRSLVLLIFTALASLSLFAQKKVTIPWKGIYIIQDSGVKITGDCIFCNPESMPNRIILDSTKRMVARKTSHPFGYSYYEWRNKDYSKSYQEFQLLHVNFKSASYFTDSGHFDPKEKNTFVNSYLSYFRNPLNKKEPHNGTYTADRIQIQCNQRAADSLLNRYPNLKDSIRHGARFWYEFNFYENGHLKSNGIVLISRLENLGNYERAKPLVLRYKIGLWLYYDARGIQNHKDFILKPLRTN